MDLSSFIKAADGAITKAFEKQGRVLPMYHVIKGDGEAAIFPAPPLSKDVSVALVRMLLAEVKATRVIYIDEAWMVDSATAGMDAAKQAQTADGLEHVPGRIEVLMYNAEDAREGCIMGRRVITRDESGKGTLGPLELMPMSHFEGRMVGLLPPASTGKPQ